MKNILVPVDLSPFSEEIINETIKLAKEINGSITLLHVVGMDIGFLIGDMGYHYLPELEETVLHEDAKKLSKFEEKIKKKGIETKSFVRQGIPLDTILSEANEQAADIIAIGSKGHGTLYETLVGSVCSDVIKHSAIPVYVIPNKKKDK